MRYTTYLRWGALSALCLAFLTPFIIADGGGAAHGFYLPITNLFFPFITGKNFIFRILIEVALLCYVLLALREPKYRPHPSLIFWTALAFVGWMAVATVFSVDPIKSFWSNFERMEGYVGLLHFFAWFLIAGAMLTVDKLWDRFFNISIALSALMGFNAVMQLVGWAQISSQSGARVDTTFGNATYLAVYLLIHVFLTLFMLARSSRTSTQQILYGTALVLQVVGLYFTETRGALLGLVGGLIIAAIWMLVRGRGPEWRGMRRVAGGLLVAIIVLTGLFFALRTTPLVTNNSTLNRLANISLEDKTTQSRFLIWNMARQGALERPVTGWGQENFNFVFNKYYTPEMYGQEAWFDRAHNEFLDWLIAGGFPAFVLYIALYALAAWAVIRSELSVAEQAAFLGLLAGYAFHNIFVFDHLVSALYFWFLLAYLHSLTQRRHPSLAWSQPLSDHGLAIVAPVIAGVILVGGWALNAPGIARAQRLVDAIQTRMPAKNADGSISAVNKGPKQNLAEFEEAVGPGIWPGGPLGQQEATEQLLQYSANTIAPSASIDPSTRQATLEAAYRAGTALLAARPGDARLELFFATFLSQAGQIGEALTHLDAGLAASPRKQQILIQKGVTQLQSGDTAAALATLKAAFELEPRFDLSRIFYVGVLVATGNSTEADKLLVERFQATEVDNQQLLQIYENLKLYDRAAGIWKLRIAKDPKNVDLYLGLASMYFSAGKKAETISVLRDIAKIQPTAAPEMEKLIKQIQDGTLKP